MIQKLCFKNNDQSLYFFLLDVSASHIRNGGLTKAINFLNSGSQIRGKYALISFGNQQTNLVCRPIANMTFFQQQIKTLKGGGGTPINQGLKHIERLAQQYQNQFSKYYLFILTDGCFNILANTFNQLKKYLDDIIVIDTQPHLKAGINLSTKLNAKYQLL